MFALTLALDARVLARAPSFAPEEHFRLGEHLYATGALSIDGSPGLFRPPGFPVFVALALRARDAVAPALGGARAVELAHALLLSLGAVAVLLFFARRLPLAAAAAAGALFALHPLNVVMARALTYPTLHVVVTAVAVMALARALEAPRHRWAWALGAGMLWGAATLVRPISLILPPFVLLLARWVLGPRAWPAALRFTAALTAGLVLVVAPYTARNYALSGRLVVVNAQEGHQLWGIAVTDRPRGDIGEWMRLWMDQGFPLYQRATGRQIYSVEGLYADTVALNDAYRAEAWRTMRAHPLRVLRNVAVNVVLWNLDAMSFWIDDFRARDGRSGLGPAKAFTVLTLLMGLAGLVVGLRDGDTAARVIAVVYAMFCLAHAIGFLLSRYNSARLPLVLLALPLVFTRARDRGLALTGLAAVAALLSALQP